MGLNIGSLRDLLSFFEFHLIISARFVHWFLALVISFVAITPPIGIEWGNVGAEFVFHGNEVFDAVIVIEIQFIVRHFTQVLDDDIIAYKVFFVPGAVCQFHVRCNNLGISISFRAWLQRTRIFDHFLNVPAVVSVVELFLG